MSSRRGAVVNRKWLGERALLDNVLDHAAAHVAKADLEDGSATSVMLVHSLHIYPGYSRG